MSGLLDCRPFEPVPRIQVQAEHALSLLSLCPLQKPQHYFGESLLVPPPPLLFTSSRLLRMPIVMVVFVSIRDVWIRC